MRSEASRAFRALLRRPGFSIAVLLTVASALAAAAIAFAVLNGVLLRPLAYAAPDRLVAVWERSVTREVPRNVVSPANFLAWRDDLHQVEQLAAVFETSGVITGGDQAEQVGILLATGDFFELLGAAPLLGRLFGQLEAVEGGPPVVVVAERYWRARYGADPGVIGRRVILNGTPREVVGVLPDRFDFAPAMAWNGVGSRDFYLPYGFGPTGRTVGGRFLQVVGRLAPGATGATAQSEASALAARLAVLFPDRQRGWDVTVSELRADLTGAVRLPITIVFVSVCLVLLVAGANVATLLRARAAERRGELALRAALGAGRLELARQVFGETLLLIGLGGLAAAGLTSWGVAALVAATPDLPRLGAIRVDPAVLGFLALATATVALLVAVGPALDASRRSPGTWFFQRGVVSDRRGVQTRWVLVGVQVAVSMVLLAGAGVLLRSLANRLGVDLGFEGERVLTAQISLPVGAYPTPERRTALFETLVGRLGDLPGVEAASAASIGPLSGQRQATSFQPLDRPRPEAGQFPAADVRFVQAAYCRAMGIPVLAGRGLAEGDRPGAPVVALVNETGARALWPGESAVGKRILMAWGDTLRAEIVGVVGDVRLHAPDERLERPTLYWDYRQVGTPTAMTVVLRGRHSVPDLSLARAALAEIASDVPFYNVRTMTALRGAALARSRFVTTTLGLFALLALGLAVLGVYGVTAYGVQQRTREIGVRLALGADRRAVVRLLLKDGARVVIPALAIGLTAAWLLAGALRSLAFEVAPRDPVAMIGGMIVIGGAALAACWIPARRAGAIPAMEAMRSD